LYKHWLLIGVKYLNSPENDEIDLGPDEVMLSKCAIKSYKFMLMDSSNVKSVFFKKLGLFNFKMVGRKPCTFFHKY